MSRHDEDIASDYADWSGFDNDPGPVVRQLCVYCGREDYEPGRGCHTCGTATVEDVANA